MHKKIYFISISICLFLLAICAGCQNDRQIVISNMEQSEETDISKISSLPNETNIDSESNSKSKQNVDSHSSDEDEHSAASELSNVSEPNIFVQISGAVHNPGVYEVQRDARMFEVIELAGGMTENAAFDSVNQAQILSDGQMIKILTLEEFENTETKEIADGYQAENNTFLDGSMTDNKMIDDQGRINLNLADEDTLCQLDGIGRTRAKQIITYRNEHGYFQSIEEIKNIKGIKDGLFNQIRDKIIV